MSSRKKKEQKKRAEPLEFPQDCERLAPSACETWKTKDPKTGVGKCKIKYSKLGFANKCVENEDYELERFIFNEGFKEFTKINTENLDYELKTRNKICENLDPDTTCKSELGKKLGCKVKKRSFSPNSCRLDPKLIRFLKKREMLCEKEDCKELKKKGIICDKCVDELQESLQELDGLYDELARRKHPAPEDVKRYFDLADEVKYDWYPYFVHAQKELLDTLEKKRMKIEELHGGMHCQAYNISGCMGKGEESRQCKCKGIKDRYGIFCGIHRKCYLSRKEKFDEFRDKFQVLCEKEELCKSLIKKMKQFYTMIRYTTVGEASVKKVEVDDIIEFSEEYLKYL